MAYRKKTLRVMSPTARKVARLIGELQSVETRLKNIIPDIQRLDLDSRALQNAPVGMVLSVNDLWGLRDCLYYAREHGYFGEAEPQNVAWSASILERIAEYRDKIEGK